MDHNKRPCSRTTTSRHSTARSPAYSSPLSPRMVHEINQRIWRSCYKDQQRVLRASPMTDVTHESLHRDVRRQSDFDMISGVLLQHVDSVKRVRQVRHESNGSWSYVSSRLREIYSEDSVCSRTSHSTTSNDSDDVATSPEHKSDRHRNCIEMSPKYPTCLFSSNDFHSSSVQSTSSQASQSVQKINMSTKIGADLQNIGSQFGARSSFHYQHSLEDSL